MTNPHTPEKPSQQDDVYAAFACYEQFINEVEATRRLFIAAGIEMPNLLIQLIRDVNKTWVWNGISFEREGS